MTTDEHERSAWQQRHIPAKCALMSHRASGLTPDQFVEKWSKAELSERAASHEHFIDLCRLIDQPTPAQADSTGEDYCFEKHVKVVGSASKGSKGEGGFVDVWKRGHFAWEYKRKDKHKTLDEAYRQLYQYRDALENPPLSVVSDIRTTEIARLATSSVDDLKPSGGYTYPGQLDWNSPSHALSCT
jgi:hypothetical protein